MHHAQKPGGDYFRRNKVVLCARSRICINVSFVPPEWVSKCVSLIFPLIHIRNGRFEFEYSLSQLARQKMSAHCSIAVLMAQIFLGEIVQMD